MITACKLVKSNKNAKEASWFLFDGFEYGNNNKSDCPFYETTASNMRRYNQCIYTGCVTIHWTRKFPIFFSTPSRRRFRCHSFASHLSLSLSRIVLLKKSAIQTFSRNQELHASTTWLHYVSVGMNLQAYLFCQFNPSYIQREQALKSIICLSQHEHIPAKSESIHNHEGMYSNEDRINWNMKLL